MLISMLFASQIIILVIGLGVGYWLLITSNGYEGRLKMIGETLAWILIVVTILLAAFNFSYSLSLASNYRMQQYCPVNNLQQQGSSDTTQTGGQIAPQGTTEGSDEGKPVKNDSRDNTMAH